MEEMGGMMHVENAHANAPRASVTRDQEIPERNSRDWRQSKTGFGRDWMDLYAPLSIIVGDVA